MPLMPIASLRGVSPGFDLTTLIRSERKRGTLRRCQLAETFNSFVELAPKLSVGVRLAKMNR